MHRFFVRASLCFVFVATPLLFAQEPAIRWLGTWASSPMGSEVNFGQPSPANTTYRNVVRISTGGAMVRVELTNEFGTRPLNIGAAHIALSAGAGAIQPGSDHALTFNGQPSVIIPPGAPMFSDPIPMQVPALASLVVSVYLPDQSIGETTCHQEGMTTSWITEGNTTAAETVTGARTISSFCFAKAVEVIHQRCGRRRHRVPGRLHHRRGAFDAEHQPPLARYPRRSPPGQSKDRAPIRAE